MANSNKSTSRPMSPHLQIWRWHATMASSIFHRASGVANIAGVLLLLWWIIALSLGETAYASFQTIAGSAFGKLVIFGILVSVCYHIANGIRFLLFGLGIGMDKHTATKSAWAVMVLGVLGAIGLFFLGLAAGVVS